MRPVDRIIAACERVRAEGGLIRANGWGLTQEIGPEGPVWTRRFGQCCPLGAVLEGELGYPSDGYSAAASRALGVSLGWVADFVSTIDGFPPPADLASEGYRAALVVLERMKGWG